jgi:hypothetical protein
VRDDYVIIRVPASERRPEDLKWSTYSTLRGRKKLNATDTRRGGGGGRNGTNVTRRHGHFTIGK